MTEILYNFAENHDGLDHIQRVVNDIHTMADDIHKIFTGISDLWQGATPEELQATHVRINQKLTDYLGAITGTASHAGNQQDEMQNPDQSLANF